MGFKILVVTDEPKIQDILAWSCSQHSYYIFVQKCFVVTAGDFLKKAKERGEPFDLIVLGESSTAGVNFLRSAGRFGADNEPINFIIVSTLFPTGAETLAGYRGHFPKPPSAALGMFIFGLYQGSTKMSFEDRTRRDLR